MTRFHEDPRLTAYALGELDAEERRQLEETLGSDTAARLELEEIGRVALLVERELAGPTGLRLSARQKSLLEGEWQARSASAGEAGAPGDTPSLFNGRSASPTLLDDFARPQGNRSARRRFAKALLAAVLLHSAAAAALVIFPSTARELVEEQLDAVAFAPRPSPESPPLAEPGVKLPSLRPKRVRPAVPVPVEVSDDRLTESDRAVPREDEMSGLISMEEVELGTGSHAEPHPPQLALAPLIRPVARDGTNIAPKYPVTAKRKGIEGKVVVTFDVLEDGTVANVKPISGPPELFDSVIRAIGSWRFKPALRGGKPVRYSMMRAVTFRLEAL